MPHPGHTGGDPHTDVPNWVPGQWTPPPPPKKKKDGGSGAPGAPDITMGAGGGGGGSSGFRRSGSSSTRRGFSRGGGGGGGFRQPTTHEVGESNLIQRLGEMYVTFWGESPPPGYLEGLRAKGMNFYEIMEHERSKPAFRLTKFYRDQFARMAGELSQIFGSR